MADSAYAVTGGESQSHSPAALAAELVRATECGATAAADHVGRGDERRAHDAAWRSMHAALETLQVTGRVVIGDDAEGGQASYQPLQVGAGNGPVVDLALDPLEGATLTAKAMGGALSVLAATPPGGLLRMPRLYMEKIAIGPGYAAGTVDLDRSPADNVRALAGAKGVPADAIVVCVLDRPRNARLIAELRASGARIRMISDGDIAGVIHTSEPEAGIDMYLGSGGASEGVLAAAALKCSGGFFQGRLTLRNAEDERLAAENQVQGGRIYSLNELVSGDVVFAATGVTQGAMLDGVERRAGRLHTHSLVMESARGVTRRIRTQRSI